MPAEATGLLCSIAQARDGNDRALLQWDRAARPVLVRALERAGADFASADEAVLHLMEAAHVAVCRGTAIHCEAAWMSAVLARTWRRSRRRGRQEQWTAAALAARGCEVDPGDPPRTLEIREELTAAASRLPPRFALTIRLYLHGLERRDVRTRICAELAVAPEQARRIERLSLDRMRTLLGARRPGA